MGKDSRLRKERKKQRIPQPHASSGHMLTLEERNVTLLNAIIDVFRLNKVTDWDSVKRDISADQIRKLYEVVSWLWPPSTDFTRILPARGSRLRALYLGDVDPSAIVPHILRFSLYSDEILIFDPFHIPWQMSDEFNPIKHPEQYKYDTIKLVFFMAAMDPMIRNGLVKLIPRVDRQIPELRSLAEVRLRGYQPDAATIEDATSDMKYVFLRTLSTVPQSQLVPWIKSTLPDSTEEDIEGFLSYLQKIRKEDPLAVDQDADLIGNQMLVTRTGANLETTLYVSQLTDAFPYTSMKFKWTEILSIVDYLPETAKAWSPLSKAFQELDFNFLNNVDPQFAYSLRADGRLESFRGFLRRLWNTVSGEADTSKIDSITRDFRDELTGEYAKAKSEWSKIDRDVMMWAGGSIVAALGTAELAKIVTGSLDVALGLAGSALAAVLKIIEARTKKKDFRRTMPMSVFVDLSKHRPRR